MTPALSYVAASVRSTSFLDSTPAAILICLVCALLVGAAVLLLTTRPMDVSRRVGGYFEPRGNSKTQATRSFVERALGDKQARAIAKSPFWEQLAVDIDVAEIKIPIDYLVLGIVVLTILGAWLLVAELGTVIAIPLAIVVPIAAFSGIRMTADKRRRLFDEQLPDNLQVIASAMRAGQTFVGALQAVSTDAPEPSKRELVRAVTDESIGIPLADALSHVTERMKSEDFQHVAVVASLQRDTGGNTAEVVDLVSDTIRERIEIRRMVRGLTAQGRLAGFILSFLPVGLLLIISVVNPSYAHPLFHSTGGLIALGAGVVLTVCGSLVIRKIVNIKI